MVSALVGAAWFDSVRGGGAASGRRLLPSRAAARSQGYCATGAYAAHFRGWPAVRRHMVARQPLHCLQFRSRRQVRHLGAADQRGRPGSDHQRAGSQLATELVPGWKIHRVSLRTRRWWLVRGAGAGRRRITKKSRYLWISSKLVSGCLPHPVSNHAISRGKQILRDGARWESTSRSADGFYPARQATGGRSRVAS